VSALLPTAERNVRRLLHQLFEPAHWPRGKTLARLLLEGLDDAAGVTGDEAERAGPRGEQFAAMVRRVARDFESHPLRHQFIQLLQDERELLDDQIPPLVEYLYSSVVNNFKGELAELLAGPAIHRFAKRLGFPVRFVSGWEIAEPKLKAIRLVWAKGADGLLVVEGPRLGIAGVIEIKSYRMNVEEMAVQAANHIRRLRRALRIGAQEQMSDAYDFVLPDGSRVPAASAPIDVEVASLCVRTPPSPLTKVTLTDGLSAVAELPFTKDELSKAAFAMAEWFLARLGPVVFHLPGDPRPGTVVTGWPGNSLEEAGRWATREAFHHMAARLERYRLRNDSERTKRALRNTYWLYNAMGWGYEHARGDRMVWGSDLEPPPGEVDAGIDLARGHYRNAKFDDARAVLTALRTKNPDDAQLRSIRWLEGMVEYRDLRFADARSRFPGASGNRSDVWNDRDLLMQARLAARTGLLDDAEALLDRTLAFGRTDLGFLIECEGVRALVCVFRGDRPGASKASARAKANRNEAARLVDERRAAGRDDPEIEWQGLTMGTLDLAASATVIRDEADAEWWIRSMTVRMEVWVISWVERDPLLASIQPRIGDWLSGQRS
jgi:hypothetical protein